MRQNKHITFGTNSSKVVAKCQFCNNVELKDILFLGYLPPVNTLLKIGSKPLEQPSYPAQLLYCSNCHLVQLGLIVDPIILFPYSYPYTSSTTKVLRDNFANLRNEIEKVKVLSKKDLIVDIGSNDGNLLKNFKTSSKVLGVTPEEIGKLAIKEGIPTIIDYFTTPVTKLIIKKFGKASIITATNVFAHIEDIHTTLNNIKHLMKKDGIFISESHYLLSLIKTLQYDTIYHEHLRYYSLTSLNYLFQMHDLEIIQASEIPPHGGSIRVYAANKGIYKASKTVAKILRKERENTTNIKSLQLFNNRVMISKLHLLSLLYKLKKTGNKIYGISAPSRASTLINFTGIDKSIIECVLEVHGSYKIGHYIPGTLIPIEDESKLYNDQPDYVILFSWHIANELIPKLKRNGFKGNFIIPLPTPHIVKNSNITTSK